jgi:hypothetical protein
MDALSKEEFDRFFDIVEVMKHNKDTNGLYWFDIPLDRSSRETEATKLEQTTFASWLKEHDFGCEALIWYLNYCCKDDYGLGVDFVSAWAGIHYFAGRKGDFAPHYSAKEFTWPEGNGRLVDWLSKYIEKKILKEHLAFDFKINDRNVEVFVYDNKEKITKKIIAEKVIVGTPQFVNQQLFKGRCAKDFQYAPWFIATLVIDKDFEGCDHFAWDNAIYLSEGLGYIYNQHQNINQVTGHKVISFYYSFNEKDLKKARKRLFKMNDNEIKELVLNDLKKAHFFIEDFILEIQFHKIGHGMIAPVPNHIFGENTQRLKMPIDRKIFFAHSDLSGISIFEEAFYQGIAAAKQVLA